LIGIEIEERTMRFVYEKFDVDGIKFSTSPFGFLRTGSLQKGALVNYFYLHYKSIIRNGFTLKSLFLKACPGFDPGGI